MSALACTEPGIAPTTVDAPVERPMLAASAMSSCSPGTFRNTEFVGSWLCLQNVSLYGGSQLLRENLPGAVAAWDAALQATGQTFLPRFLPAEAPVAATTIVNGPNTGTEFCGSVSPSKAFTVVNETDPACATNNNRGPLLDLLIHEMAHYVGWAGGFHTGHNNGIAGVSDHCTLALPSTGGLNTTICHHNVEGVVAAYGLRTLSNPSSFWSTPFVVSAVGADLPDTLSLYVDSTATLQPGAFLKERGGTLTGAWTFQSSDTAVASSFGGMVTAKGIGEATITIRPVEGSEYYLTSAFRASTRTVPVVVTEPPPPPPEPPADLVVYDISVNTALPITSAGTYQWTAVIGPGNPAGISYRWVIEYSDASPPDSVFIPARHPDDPGSPWVMPMIPESDYIGVGQSVSQPVHLGSYTIRVKVWPIRGGSVGAPSVRDFPVCPPGQGNDLHGGGVLFGSKYTGKKSGPGTNAVEGCAP